MSTECTPFIFKGLGILKNVPGLFSPSRWSLYVPSTRLKPVTVLQSQKTRMLVCHEVCSVEFCVSMAQRRSGVLADRPPVQCRATPTVYCIHRLFCVLQNNGELVQCSPLTSMTQYRGIFVQVTVHVELAACQSSRAAPDRWPHCCTLIPAFPCSYFVPAVSLWFSASTGGTVCLGHFHVFFFFFFRRYNFNRWMFCPSQHIISIYCDPGCS